MVTAQLIFAFVFKYAKSKMQKNEYTLFFYLKIVSLIAVKNEMYFHFVSFFVRVNNFSVMSGGTTASWVLPVLLGGICILLKDTTRRPE